MGKYTIAAAILASQLCTINAFSSTQTTARISSCRQSTTEDWTSPELSGTSLVADTLLEMESDVEFQELTKKIAKIGVDGMTKEERTIRRRALDEIGVPNFMTFVT